MTTPTNLPPSGEPSASTAETLHKFEFTGTAGEMVPIILKNLLFNILTLSLYRFWGRTNIRRYIWENTRFKDDPFEYTGTGGEMFVGFLIVMVAVFLPLIGLMTWAQTLAMQGDITGTVLFFVLYLFILWLIPFGLYRAFKYRMSRTRWRGVRGAQLGSGAKYATETFSYSILTGLTLGLLYPFMDNKLYSLETNDRRFGSGRFSYKAGAGTLYKAFFVSVGVAILASLVLGFLGLFSQFAKAVRTGAQPDADFFISVFGSYIIFLVVMGLAFSLYAYAKLQHFWNNTKFQTAEFRFVGTLGGLIKLFVGNIALTIVTLGIAYPIAQMRVVRFMVENMSLEGSLDLSKISQSDEAEPSFGEGLAEGFDMGTI
ncbi:MAG: DUF898 domain-containing protein [Alphaproteobacteria bacterium]|nr:DUF898 domain-containing protein [Alphaproteobacteria bacterium]